MSLDKPLWAPVGCTPSSPAGRCAFTAPPSSLVPGCLSHCHSQAALRSGLCAPGQARRLRLLQYSPLQGTPSSSSSPGEIPLPFQDPTQVSVTASVKFFQIPFPDDSFLSVLPPGYWDTLSQGQWHGTPAPSCSAAAPLGGGQTCRSPAPFRPGCWVLPSAPGGPWCLSPASTWARSPTGSRCLPHPAGSLGSTLLGCMCGSGADGDVENICDIFQTGLLSYHERLRQRRQGQVRWELGTCAHLLPPRFSS